MKFALPRSIQEMVKNQTADALALKRAGYRHSQDVRSVWADRLKYTSSNDLGAMLGYQHKRVLVGIGKIFQVRVKAGYVATPTFGQPLYDQCARTCHIVQLQLAHGGYGDSHLKPNLKTRV